VTLLWVPTVDTHVFVRWAAPHWEPYAAPETGKKGYVQGRLQLIVAILADTHMPRGKRTLPRKCLELMEGAGLILHAGDVLTEEVLSELEAIGPPVQAVCGNMDSNALRRRLPLETTVEVENARIGIVHDAGPRHGRITRLRKEFPDADAVVFGHSHIPLHERDGEFQIFNPGSPTERRRAPHHTMGLARVEAGEIEFELVVLG
jgi:uncharacterized protein